MCGKLVREILVRGAGSLLEGVAKPPLAFCSRLPTYRRRSCDGAGWLGCLARCSVDAALDCASARSSEFLVSDVVVAGKASPSSMLFSFGALASTNIANSSSSRRQKAVSSTTCRMLDPDASAINAM